MSIVTICDSIVTKGNTFIILFTIHISIPIWIRGWHYVSHIQSAYDNVLGTGHHQIEKHEKQAKAATIKDKHKQENNHFHNFF